LEITFVFYKWGKLRVINAKRVDYFSFFKEDSKGKPSIIALMSHMFYFANLSNSVLTLSAMEHRMSFGIP
jgi:hypothetical protein